MKAILVFIDGTICDTRPRHNLIGTPDFSRREEILKDIAVAGSVECVRDLAEKYRIVYLGARPSSALADTEEWLAAIGFPQGPVYLARWQQERLELVRKLGKKFDFVAGIGDRWDDNELHLELGCMSIILKEYEGNWDTVRRYLL